MLCCSFIDQQNISKLFLKSGQKAKDVVFTGQSKEAGILLQMGHAAMGTIFVCAPRFILPLLK